MAYLFGLAGRRKVDPRSAISAAVDGDGQLRSVSELRAKLARGAGDWRRLVVCIDDEETAREAIRGDLPEVIAASDVLRAAGIVAKRPVSGPKAVAAAAVAVAVMALGSWHLVNASRAAAQLSAVNARESQALQLASAATKLAAAQPTTALRLAVSAFHLDPASARTRAALIQLTQTDPRIKSYLGVGGGPAITMIAGSPSGAVVVSADNVGTVLSWRVACGRCSPLVISRGPKVSSIAVERDGGLVAVARDDDVKLTTPTGRPATGWPASLRTNAAVNVVAISYGGEQIAAGTADGGVYVWTRGRPVPAHQVARGGEPISAAIFLPDGRLVTGTAAPDRRSPQELEVWKTATAGLAGSQLTSPETPTLALPGVRALAVVGSDLVIGETYLEIRPLDALNKSRTVNVVDPVDDLVPLDGTHVLVGTTSSLTPSALPSGGSPPTSFIDVDTVSGHTQASPFSASLNCLTPASTAGPGHTILTGTTSGVLVEWSLAAPPASEALRIVPDPMNDAGVIVSRDNGAVDAFNAATKHQSVLVTAKRHGAATALAAYRNTVYVGYVDGTVLRLIRRPGARPVQFLHLPEKVLSVAVDPVGRTLAVGGSDGHVTLFDAVTGRQLRTLPDPHAASIYDVAFNPDGTLIASSDVRDGLLVQRVNGTATESAAVLSAGLVDWLNDATLIVGDGEGNLYRLPLPLPAHPKPIARPNNSNILGGDLDPQRRTLVTASADQTAVLFDLGARQTLGTFPTLDADRSGSFAAAAWAASFTLNGRYAVFGTAEGHLQTLTTDTAVLAASACAMAAFPPSLSSSTSKAELQAARSACP